MFFFIINSVESTFQLLINNELINNSTVFPGVQFFFYLFILFTHLIFPVIDIKQFLLITCQANLS